MAYFATSNVSSRIRLCLGLFLGLACNAIAHTQAATFAVQVGAFTSPSTGLADAYQQYGSVRVQRDNGLSRVLIGSFENREDAQLMLLELKREGFTDAFVRILEATQQSEGAAEHKHLPADDLRRLSDLTAEEKSRAVYLDGVLHLKQGDEFIPLR